MNAFELFLSTKPYGFLSESELAELVKLHRLCLCLVRLGGSGGRFIAPAQNVAQLIQYAEKAGDYVRDVSVYSPEIANAHKWQAELTPEQLARLQRKVTEVYAKPQPKTVQKIRLSENTVFNEGDCGGAFDGTQVTSDADPGL